MKSGEKTYELSCGGNLNMNKCPAKRPSDDSSTISHPVNSASYTILYDFIRIYTISSGIFRGGGGAELESPEYLNRLARQKHDPAR